MSDDVKPITPDEVAATKQALLPGFVIQAFNNLIAKNWHGQVATFTVTDAINEILRLGRGEAVNPSKKSIEEEHYLDVEQVFMAAGWDVQYDQPGYNETGVGMYQFRRKGTK